jgi:hypothetical protein
MGNGYTFELETLIFLSVSIVCAEEAQKANLPGVDILVYGDDIIVPTGTSATLIPVLKYLGFETNASKTFLTGPFRESCGGDFFNGMAVRSHYLKEYPTLPSDWISLVNGIYRACSIDGVLCEWGKRAWHRAMDPIPYQIRQLRVPPELGDLGINQYTSPYDPRVTTGVRSDILKSVFECDWPKSFVEDGIRYFRVWRPVHEPIPLDYWKPGVVLAYALYGGSPDGPVPRINGEDRVSGYRMDYVPFS